MSSSNNIIKIMNHINKLKHDDAIFDYLDSIENMNQIFNKLYRIILIIINSIKFKYCKLI
jgi:hypothetical protein